MRLIDADTLKGMVVRENNLVLKRLMSAIDRVEKVDAIPVKYLEKKIDKYLEENMKMIADEFDKVIKEWREHGEI